MPLRWTKSLRALVCSVCLAVGHPAAQAETTATTLSDTRFTTFNDPHHSWLPTATPRISFFAFMHDFAQPGALPIVVDDEVIGSMGVSSANGEKCAQAAIDAVFKKQEHRPRCKA